MSVRSHLVIGDAHVKPGISNRRFHWLGKFIAKHKPDVIIDIGDWEDMPSLASMDYGKLAFEGRRYKDDIESALEARAIVQSYIRNVNVLQRRRKDKLYRPELHAISGNHFEGRINRFVQNNPQMSEFLKTERDGRYQEFGWDFHRFLEPVIIDGISYCHYYQIGNFGKCVGGEHPASNLLKHKLQSCIMGHLHIFDHAHRTRADGSKIHCFIAGCYLDPDQHEDYAHQSNKNWDRGLLLLKGVNSGTIEGFSWYSIEEIQREFG